MTFSISAEQEKKRHAEASYKNLHLQTVSFVLSISSRAKQDMQILNITQSARKYKLTIYR